MEHSEQLDKLAESLAKAQGEFPPVPFNQVNPFLKNKYSDLGSLISTTKPIMKKYGLSVTQLVYGYDDTIGVTTMLLHESGQWISNNVSLPLGEEKGKNSAQVAGSIISYLRRYSLGAILGLYSDEDVDGNAPVVEKVEKKVVQEVSLASETNDEKKKVSKDAWTEWDKMVARANKVNVHKHQNIIAIPQLNRLDPDITLTELRGHYGELMKAVVHLEAQIAEEEDKA